MNAQPMINLLEAERLLCNRCYVDLQDENFGEFDPDTRLHRSIPWQRDVVCCCCHAAPADYEARGYGSPVDQLVRPSHNGKPCMLTPVQGANFIRADGGAVSVELARENGFFD